MGGELLSLVPTGNCGILASMEIVIDRKRADRRTEGRREV